MIIHASDELFQIPTYMEIIDLPKRRHYTDLIRNDKELLDFAMLSLLI